MYTKSGEGEKRKCGESDKANIVLKGEGFSLKLGFRIFCVHRQWIQSYFRFHKNVVFTGESSKKFTVEVYQEDS